jgi:hypothetical protein
MSRRSGAPDIRITGPHTTQMRIAEFLNRVLIARRSARTLRRHSRATRLRRALIRRRATQLLRVLIRHRATQRQATVRAALAAITAAVAEITAAARAVVARHPAVVGRTVAAVAAAATEAHLTVAKFLKSRIKSSLGLLHKEQARFSFSFRPLVRSHAGRNSLLHLGLHQLAGINPIR